MFRRTSSDAPTPEPVIKPDGKGRPTPTRKEAEAAARDRARMAFDKKAMSRRQRETRTTSSREIREGMKRGEEKYLSSRDKGPVRRFVRDFVDSRVGFTELFLPIVIVVFAVPFFTATTAALQFVNALMATSTLLVITDIMILRFRVRRGVAERFAGESLKGITWYAVSRAVNMRFMRVPKPQVKIGQPLPENYR